MYRPGPTARADTAVTGSTRDGGGLDTQLIDREVVRDVGVPASTAQNAW